MIDMIAPLFHKSRNMRELLYFTTESFIVLDNHHKVICDLKQLWRLGVNTSIIP